MRKLLAIALYLFIGLPSLLGGLFLAPARSWLLDREFYKQIVSGPEIRAVLESPALYEGYGETLVADESLALDGPAAGKALKAAMPVDALLDATEGIVDSVFDSLQVSPGAGRLQVDLGVLKSALEGSVPEFARVYSIEAPSASSKPDRPRPEAALDLSVRPVGVSESAFRELVESSLDTALIRLPEKAEAGLSAPAFQGAWGKSLSGQKALDRSALLLLILGGGVCLAGAFVASDSASKRLKWLGRAVLLPGVVVLASGAILRIAADPLILGAIQDADLQKLLSDPALAAVRAWIRKPLGTVSSGFLLSGSVAVILGGGLSASRKALKYRDLE
jgi:hypothetical protein